MVLLLFITCSSAECCRLWVYHDRVPDVHCLLDDVRAALQQLVQFVVADRE